MKSSQLSLCCVFVAGGEGLAADRHQRLQRRQRQHLQLGTGGGLHVRRPRRPQGVPVGGSLQSATLLQMVEKYGSTLLPN